MKKNGLISQKLREFEDGAVGYLAAFVQQNRDYV